ncbi:MAG: DUF5694 domain-containing protein [Gammaproteobacteria bacterium]
MRRLNGFLILVLALIYSGCTATTPSQDDTAQAVAASDDVQVMVLGSYHFAGSSSDLVNLDVDSVLTDARQQELQGVANALAQFKPTAVVTERVTDAPFYLDPHYREFTPEWLTERSNERVQLAYRVAHQLRLQRVYGLDEQPADGEPDYFPFGKLAAHAAQTGLDTELNQFVQEFRGKAENEMARLNQGSIAEALLAVNNGPLSKPDFYYQLQRFDQGEAQPAAELQGYWFMRNAKIFSKLDDVVQPGDRVLVVYGAGHKFWLEHLVTQTPGYALIKPDAYLQRAVPAP